MRFNIIFINNQIYFKILIFLTAYFSIFISLYFGEDSTGGAVLDYQNQQNVIKEFVKSFKFAFLNYDSLPATTRHSPVLISIIAFFVKLNFSEFFIKLIYIHVNLLLPIFFYKSLKLKFKNIDSNYLFLLSIIIFLSPTFRTLIVWPDSRILGVTLFSISIFYFLKFLENYEFKFALYNIFFYTLSSYISPNFSIFSIYFLYIYFKKYHFLSKTFIKIIIINLFLALPAFYYVFVLEVNFFFAKATASLSGDDKLFFNYSNQILIIPTILFFYFLPFILTKTVTIDYSNKFATYTIASLIITSIAIFFFDYKIEFTGGGIFFHLSNLLFGNNIIFFSISFISIYLVLNIFSKNFENLLLLMIIFLGNPQTTIYHKYYDPLMILLIFSLIITNLNLKNLSKIKSISAIYVYFLVFLAISNFKHLLN